MSLDLYSDQQNLQRLLNADNSYLQYVALSTEILKDRKQGFKGRIEDIKESLQNKFYYTL